MIPQDIKLAISGKGEHIIRFGDAEKVLQREGAVTHTNFQGLVKYIKHRRPNDSLSIIECNAEKIVITLYEDKGWPSDGIVYATEVINPKLEEFGINTSKIYDRKQLLDFLKKNIHFLVADSGPKILLSLSNLSAKIEKSIEQGETNKGSKHNNFSQNINLNTAPEALTFTLSIPIILGQPKMPIQVDICYDSSGNNVVFWLECIALNELIEKCKEELVEKVKLDLNELGYLVIDTTK